MEKTQASPIEVRNKQKVPTSMCGVRLPSLFESLAGSISFQEADASAAS
jgi:hypothetical protein